MVRHDPPEIVPRVGIADAARGRLTRFARDPPLARKNSFRAAIGTYAATCNLAPRLRVVLATTDTKMKTITFLLSLVGASLTVTAASAAVQNDNENVIDLPAYRVTAPRYTAAEKAIASSLAEFSAKARPAFAVRTELPSLNVVAKQQSAPQHERSVAAKLSPTRVDTRS